MSENNKQATIAIIGAGVAGPVLALSILLNPTLNKLYKPIIYDKLPPPSDTSDLSSNERGRSSYAAGAAVALASNALYPLYQLGLKDSLDKISCETTTINVWRTWNDAKSIENRTSCPHKWYNIIRNPNWTPEFETNLRVVERKDLQGVLLEKFSELGGEVVWGKKLKDVQSSEQGSLKLVFGDGGEAETDLLVGGDGNWSSVRKHIIEKKGTENGEKRWAPDFPFCGGVYGISAGFGTAAMEGNDPGDTHWILLDKGMASTWALPDGKLFWTISIPEASPPERSLAAEGGKKQTLYGADVTCGGYSFESTTEILRKHESIWHPIGGSFGEIFKNSDRIVRAPLWHKTWDVDEIGNSNMVVIGDASRAMLPTSGQGACFAIEDAIVLANSLLNHPPSKDAGLRFQAAISEYANLRVPRSKRMANQSYWTGVVGLAGRFWWRWLRDFGTAYLPLGGDPKANPEGAKKDPMAWLYNVRYKVEVEDKGQSSGD